MNIFKRNKTAHKKIGKYILWWVNVEAGYAGYRHPTKKRYIRVKL